MPRPPISTLFPYTTLFRSRAELEQVQVGRVEREPVAATLAQQPAPAGPRREARLQRARSEEHTSELQSHSDLVCRLLLEKKNLRATNATTVSTSNHRRT